MVARVLRISAAAARGVAARSGGVALDRLDMNKVTASEAMVGLLGREGGKGSGKT
jgi:hypothetical protein